MKIRNYQKELEQDVRKVNESYTRRTGVWVPVVKSHHYKVLNRPGNQRYDCYGASRVPYAPRKYAESTGNAIL